MRRKPTTLISLVITASAFLSVGINIDMTSAEEKKSVREISLDEFVQVVTKNDTVFEQILIDQLVLVYQKDLRLPARDLVLAENRTTFLR